MVGLVIFVLCLLFLKVPSHEAAQLAAGRFEWKALRQVLGNRDLWFIGPLLTISWLRGFVIPVIFGIIINGSGYTPAFDFGGISCVVFAMIGFAAREPKCVSATASKPIASLEGVFEPLH